MTIQTKMNVGDTAYFMHDTQVTSRVVGSIDTTTIETAERGYPSAIVSNTTYSFRMYNDYPDEKGAMTWLCLYEHLVFATKEELLASL